MNFHENRWNFTKKHEISRISVRFHRKPWISQNSVKFREVSQNWFCEHLQVMTSTSFSCGSSVTFSCENMRLGGGFELQNQGKEDSKYKKSIRNHLEFLLEQWKDKKLWPQRKINEKGHYSTTQSHINRLRPSFLSPFSKFQTYLDFRNFEILKSVQVHWRLKG